MMAQSIVHEAGWRQQLKRRVWRRWMVALTYLAIVSIFVGMPVETALRINAVFGWSLTVLLAVVAIAGVAAEWFWLNGRAFWWSRGVSRKERTADRLIAAGATVQEIDEALTQVDEVDERQRSVIDRSYRYAYRILTVTVGAAFLIAQLAPSVVPVYNWVGLFLTVVATLPTAGLAWTEPEPLDEG